MIDYSDMIGKPFKDGGYGPDNYDCYGATWEAHRRNGLYLPRTNISVLACKNASNEEILRHIARSWEKIERPEVICGVRMEPIDPRFAEHVAAYVGRGKILHATIDRGVAIDRLSEWKHSVIGYYRYVGNSNIS